MEQARDVTAARARTRATKIRLSCKRLLGWVATACLVGGMDPGVAAGQQPAELECDPCRWGRDREIGNHVFLIPNFIDSALVLSYLGVRAGLELESIPDVQFVRTFDVDQIRLGASVDGSVQLFDRVGLFVELASVASAATNAEATVTRGTDYRLLGRLGAIVKLLRIEASGTQLSARAFVETQSGDVLSLFPVLNALADEPVGGAVGILESNLDGLLLTPFSAFVWGGGIAAAQPLTPVFSAQASVRVSVEYAQLEPVEILPDDRGAFEWTNVTPELGLALTGDADPLGVPFALLLEYQVSFAQTEIDRTGQDSSDTFHTLGAGVYYTGRTDLQAGLVYYTLIDSDPLLTRRTSEAAVGGADTPSLNGFRLILRYFW